MYKTLEEKWYVINTKINQEDRVEHQLSKLNLEIFNPKHLKEKKVWGQKKTVKSPLFPSYIFAKFNVQQYSHMIQYTRGVKKILTFGAEMLSVDDHIIERLKARVLADEFDTVKQNDFAAGSEVSIELGPLNGLKAIFSKELSDKKRVIVLLDLLGASTQVVLDKRVLKSA